MRTLLLSLSLVLAGSLAGCTHSPVREAATGEHRPADHLARNAYRHPVETLQFFGVETDMTVVEIWPGGGGWYTEVLAPLLREQGTFYAAHFPPDSDIPFYTRNLEKYRAKLDVQPDIYNRVKVTYLWPPKYIDIAPPASADRVLTFRNVHNWAKAGKTAAYFDTFYTALKPGGILGVVEHRAPAGRSLEDMIESGYMTEEYVIRMAEQAGFKLVDTSEINANPDDDASHPRGVWTLPPTLRLGEEDREKYLKIGESDRMTLKFLKPAE